MSKFEITVDVEGGWRVDPVDRSYPRKEAEGNAWSEPLGRRCAEAVQAVLEERDQLAPIHLGALRKSVEELAEKLGAWHRIATGDGDHYKADIYEDIESQLRALLNREEKLAQSAGARLQQMLIGTARGAIAIPTPGGVLGLVALGESMTHQRCTDHRTECVKHPTSTLKDGGGDWDDVTLLLMAAAGSKGFGTRVACDGQTIFLQALDGITGEWTTIGPRALVR